MNSKKILLIFFVFFVFSFLAYLCLWVIIRNINLKYSFIDELFNENNLIHNILPAVCMALISSIGCVVPIIFSKKVKNK